MLIAADSNFKQLSFDLPQYQSFINKSGLIISLGTIQMPFKKELSISDLRGMSKFLIGSDFKDNLLCLSGVIERLEDEHKAMIRQKRNEGLKELVERIAGAKREIDTFPINELEIRDDIDIQIIFPGVNMAAIQAIKRHPLMNAEKTCLCKACIRALLF
jgi:hypothetical protein